MLGGVANLPDDTKKLLVSMLDDEPCPLSLSDALAFAMMGLISDGEQHLDGWYYKLTSAGRRAAESLLPAGTTPAADAKVSG